MLTADLVHVRRRGDQLSLVPLGPDDLRRAGELAQAYVGLARAHLGLQRGAFLEACRAPRLFVQGEADPFGDGDFMRRLMERLPEPRTLVVVPGADHFFGGHLEELQDALAAWAAARPWATAIAEPR